MRLTVVKENIYVLECTIHEAQIPRVLGFTWWSIVTNKWATLAPAIAVRAFEWADESAKAALSEIAARQQRNRKASAADAPSQVLGLLVPDGLGYLPFQEAGIEYMAQLLEER